MRAPPAALTKENERMSVRRLAPKELQPASFAFTEENLAWARQQMEKYPPGRQASAVIAIMWRAQEQNRGWGSGAANRAIADLLDMAYIRVLEVATFYTMFQLQPVGSKAHIQVCGTTPCRLRGAEDLIELCQHRIHHDPFHLSKDGEFSWEEVECLGRCLHAAMVLIWSDTYEDLTKESFAKLLDGFASGNPPKPGPQIDRQFSAPVGGLTALKNGGGGATNTSSVPKEPVLADAEAKKPGAAANVHERPSPKPPADDATRKDPP